jgi:hypothetical protein
MMSEASWMWPGMPRSLMPAPAPVKWGTGFRDFDNDGWLDVLVANGKRVSSRRSTAARKHLTGNGLQLFRNLEGRTFDEVCAGYGLE